MLECLLTSLLQVQLAVIITLHDILTTHFPSRINDRICITLGRRGPETLYLQCTALDSDDSVLGWCCTYTLVVTCPADGVRFCASLPVSVWGDSFARLEWEAV